MPQKLFDDEGKEVEVKTAEEIEADKQSAVEAAKKEVQDTTKTQIETLTTDLNAAKTDLNKVKANGGKTPEELAEIAKKEKEVEHQQTLVDAAKTAGKQAVLQSYADTQIEKLAGSDPKLKDAVKKHLKDITGSETQDQVNHMIRQAYVLGNDEIGVTPSSSIIQQTFGGGGGSGRTVGAGPQSNISDELKELGRKQFGLEDADWDKWGGVKHSTAD